MVFDGGMTIGVVATWYG